MGGTTDTLLLLTDEARHAKLDALFGHRFTDRGRLMLPTMSDYNSIHSDQGLKELGNEMCRWLGMKPNGLHITYSDKSSPVPSYIVDLKTKTIIISRQFRIHPYTAGATLALAVLAYAIERHNKSIPDEVFIEFASLELGLGLWIVNALKPRLSLHERIYHIIDAAWFHAEGIQLSGYSAQQYADKLATYAHANHIATESYLPHVTKRCQYLFPDFMSQRTKRHLPAATTSLQHQKAAKLLWFKIFLISLILAAGVSLGVYSSSQRSNAQNPQIQQQAQQIKIMKQVYNNCLSEASDFQSKNDPNDLFMTRQADAIKSRCESLRNEYNSSLDQYQKLYSKD